MKGFSMNEMHAELSVPCDYVTSGNGYYKGVITSTAKSKRVLKITNCTKNGPLTTRVSVFADDITAFVSRRLDIKAVK